jgi:hypothetical protein
MANIVLDLSVFDSGKRKQGRPKKTNNASQFEMLGRVQKPSHDDAVFELKYCDIATFQSLFTFLGKTVDKTIQVQSGDVFKILAKDRLDKTVIRVTTTPDLFNSYYTTPHEFGLSIANILLLNKKLDQTYQRITWYMEEDEKKSCIFELYDPDHENEESEKLSVSVQFIKVEEPMDEEKYDVSFTLKGKKLKKSLKDAKNYKAETFIIQKNGQSGPLTFKYSTEDLTREQCGRHARYGL